MCVCACVCVCVHVGVCFTCTCMYCSCARHIIFDSVNKPSVIGGIANVCDNVDMY